MPRFLSFDFIRSLKRKSQEIKLKKLEKVGVVSIKFPDFIFGHFNDMQ